MAKILVVDDSKIIRNMMGGMLKQLEHDVVGFAKDGKEGYELYKELKPDLVTMDINMPIMDGMESLKKIKSEYSDAKVVMVTSREDEMTICGSIAEGAVGCILKPLNINQLDEKINEILK